MKLTKIDVTTKVSLANLVEKYNELVDHLEECNKPRDRGPKSERTMTEEDAIRVISGDLKDSSHKVAAETLQLSYGQIYSARKGFTFKTLTPAA
jgi:hypothetical protein